MQKIGKYKLSWRQVYEKQNTKQRQDIVTYKCIYKAQNTSSSRWNHKSSLFTVTCGHKQTLQRCQMWGKKSARRKTCNEIEEERQHGDEKIVMHTCTCTQKRMAQQIQEQNDLWYNDMQKDLCYTFFTLYIQSG